MIGSVTVETADRIVHGRTQNIGSSLSSCSTFYTLFALFIPCFMNPAHAYFTS
jgi:hypothetical protein